MGIVLGRLFSSLFGAKEVKILILGLDNAGKTTILYKIAPSEEAVMRTAPTIGFNTQQLTYKNIKFQVWDLGGQSNIRMYWKLYYSNTNAVIFVVDSADRERFDVARKELMAMCGEEDLQGSPILVFANKMDQERSASVQEVSDALGLTTLRDRQWHIQRCVAVQNDGVREGLDWLVEAINSAS